MKIGSISENQNIEKRIAITPDIVKKYISLGFEVCLIENYGSHLGIKDDEFRTSPWTVTSIDLDGILIQSPSFNKNAIL